MRSFIYVFFIFLALCLCCCGKVELPLNDIDADFFNNANTLDSIDMVDKWIADSIGIMNAQKKACQLKNIKWMPKGLIPWNNGFFQPGIEYSGIPYSSVKQINTYIGIDVSFHTFMTAVNDPRSVLYTENISLPPYLGVNCATYYGTVCSTAVAYALGIDIPYIAKMFPTIEGMEKIESQLPIDFRPSDVLVSSGHVVMVYDIVKDNNGDITNITTFETGSYLPIFTNYTQEGLVARMNQSNLVAYRYNNISTNKIYTPTIYSPVFDEVPQVPIYNNDLCPSKGDQSMYRFGEDVVINILSDEYKTISITKDGINYCEKKINGMDDITLSNLPEGFYSASLINEYQESSSVLWQVAEIHVSLASDESKTRVSFSARSVAPSYIVLCSSIGGHLHIHHLSSAEIKNGFADLPVLVNVEEYYCKVCFLGEYGSVVSLPQLVKN